MDDTPRTSLGMLRTIRQNRDRIRLVTGRSMAVTGDVGVVPMMHGSRRHGALLPRHGAAVEAERQDDQATEQ
ncbi:hypothetical protein N792_02475 [Lysobacter concretionis Ko07 = DSM 16239]|uniref:Uncharacterized protein n=1 Tax=Lysobacter concretionis Ko07 = DSM 16239 TaxID=1122185 RepID=A0A0A0EKK5_9GAMM|nr:hypothetical protein N792_02475 [Lysobacter concretionis Ko07 = DSM 16239]